MDLKRILILAYLIIGMVEVTGELFGAKTIIYLSKPLLMPVLIALLIKMVDLNASNNHRFILGALIFSLIGDVVLMITPGSNGLFITGLCSFLIGHLFYILALKNDTTTPLSENWSFGDWVIPALLIFHSILIGSLMLINLHGTMLLAVMIYVLVITVMGITASIRTRDGFTLDRVVLVIGVVLFVLSDTLIGVTKFLDPDIPLARPTIMTLYILGQLLIVLGWSAKKEWRKPDIVLGNS